MRYRFGLALGLIGLAFAHGGAGPGARADDLVFADEASLGAELFSDPDLSKNRSQSCSSCHDPEQGFVDPRESEAGRAVSLGDDGHSLGDRNAPTASYAALVPAFHRRADGEPVGGLFWDGRAARLEDQAGGPPLNPIEMGMAGKADVEARLREKPAYVAAFERFYGTGGNAAPGALYYAMTRALAAYERSRVFLPFDSKYDRYLKGELTLSEEEELGRTLFFSTQFQSCSQCHDLAGPDGKLEHSTFSSYRFFNIGVPANRAARQVNGMAADHVDLGLASTDAFRNDPAARGKFRTPSLRNVAVTGPYMHNGVFKDLRTVILFYNKYNSKKKSRQINPETGAPWEAPEVSDNLALKELSVGRGLDDRQVDALVAFLKTLTDRRYEGLMGGEN